MSDVKYSKRKKSRLEAQHMAYAIRKRITVELMASFALSQKRIEAYVESATKGIADISEREVTAKLLRELTMDRNVWFITKERDTVLDLCQGISRQLRMGNTVFPEYYSEFIERRLQLDRAMEYCNALQDELQFIAETIPCDKNKYMNIVLELNKLYNYIKSLRASDNKFLPKIKRMRVTSVQTALRWSRPPTSPMSTAMAMRTTTTLPMSTASARISQTHTTGHRFSSGSMRKERLSVSQ